MSFTHNLVPRYSECASFQASELIEIIQTKSQEWNVPVENMIFFADVVGSYYETPGTLRCELEGSRPETDFEYEIRIAIETSQEAETKRKKKAENKARLDKKKQEEYETYLKLKSKFEK